MQFFATNYNHTSDRMERISPKFGNYSEVLNWIKENGPRNSDDESIAMVGNDHCVETDYPVADSLTVEILETVQDIPKWYTPEQSAEDSRRLAAFIESYDNDTIKTGDTVRDANNYQGIVTMSDDDTVVIMWSNGMTGSFARKYLDRNRIRKFIG